MACVDNLTLNQKDQGKSKPSVGRKIVSIANNDNAEDHGGPAGDAESMFSERGPDHDDSYIAESVQGFIPDDSDTKQNKKNQTLNLLQMILAGIGRAAMAMVLDRHLFQ